MKEPRLTFLFAPGAGAPSSHPWMQHWAELLGALGAVRLLDYPYMQEGAGRPDPLPKLIAAHRAALRQVAPAGPVVLIGKSMGSRIGCHVSLVEPVQALVCLGYPLCGGGNPAKLRDKVLRELTTPVLFVQGTRDKLCPLELLEPIRAAMQARNELDVVEEGDHSLAVTKTWLKKHGETQDDVDRRILAAIRQFLTGLDDAKANGA
ncbi:MAG TPA: alpha/beta family hydrolase [Chthoniobacteraceae bacterium]|nr:alpha/beta family hydrolase [Chthoniobacteraceae bacterium]